MALTLVQAQSGQLPGKTPQQRCYTVSNPSAGADYSIQVPAGETWFLQSFKTTLVTSATVATRVPLLELGLSGALVYIAPAASGLTASNADVFVWSLGLTPSTTSNVVTMPMPNIPIQTGSIIFTSTQNIQTGDQYSTGVITVLAYT